MQSNQVLDRGVDLYWRLAERSPELMREYDLSLQAFSQTPAVPADRALPFVTDAARRHLEWFLFDRLSGCLDGVPAEVLQEEWMESSLADPELEGPEAYLGSLPGIFEVSSVEPGEGAWVRDLLGGGEYPLLEAEASSELATGDLLVGRIFPVGESSYRCSPAAGLFRNPELLVALRGDMQRLRQTRRGSMRISQLELERMFFHAAGPAPVDDWRRAMDHARSFLLESGVERETAQRWLDQLRATPFRSGPVLHGGEDLLGRMLDHLAFETDVDLERGRRLLIAAWQAASSVDSAPAPDPTAVPEPSGATDDVRAALEEFDRDRAAGGDLEQLFSELERKLGLQSEPEDVQPAPDFPGVVGAMVEEFLWELGREGQARAAEEYRQPLGALSRYAEHLGVFENLGAQDLTLFSTCWLLEESALGSADDAERMLRSLEAFCRWTEESHCIPLWSSFEQVHSELQQSLPRLAEANRQLSGESETEGAQVYVLDSDPQSTELSASDPRGESHRLPVDRNLAAHLRQGDLVRARRSTEGELKVVRCYPGVARSLISSRP